MNIVHLPLSQNTVLSYRLNIPDYDGKYGRCQCDQFLRPRLAHRQVQGYSRRLQKTCQSCKYSAFAYLVVPGSLRMFSTHVTIILCRVLCPKVPRRCRRFSTIGTRTYTHVSLGFRFPFDDDYFWNYRLIVVKTTCGFD